MAKRLSLVRRVTEWHCTAQCLVLLNSLSMIPIRRPSLGGGPEYSREDLRDVFFLLGTCDHWRSMAGGRSICVFGAGGECLARPPRESSWQLHVHERQVHGFSPMLVGGSLFSPRSKEDRIGLVARETINRDAWRQGRKMPQRWFQGVASPFYVLGT